MSNDEYSAWLYIITLLIFISSLSANILIYAIYVSYFWIFIEKSSCKKSYITSRLRQIFVGFIPNQNYESNDHVDSTDVILGVSRLVNYAATVAT